MSNFAQYISCGRLQELFEDRLCLLRSSRADQRNAGFVSSYQGYPWWTVTKIEFVHFRLTSTCLTLSNGGDFLSRLWKAFMNYQLMLVLLNHFTSSILSLLWISCTFSVL